MANPLTRLLLDPVAPTRDRAPQVYRLPDDWRGWAVPLGLGAALVALSLIGLATDGARFFYAYLVGWAFCVTIAVGALFFVMIQHITKAKWSTTIRRIPEGIAASFPLLALLGLPILFGLHDLYHWTHAGLYEVGGPEFDRVVAGKAGYFFTPFEPGAFPLFWFARVVAYFLVWGYLGRRLWTLSVTNDVEPRAENTLAARKTSAWGIPASAVALSFAAYDLVMSLDPHWFSTIFGVYFFAGGWLAALALITFIALLWRKGGLLHEEVTTEHLQDMGKLMFGFTVFWTYIAFSQYMLYWYGNLPEEIRWYHVRLSGGWEYLSAALLIAHFILPFLALLPRVSKRTLPFLAFMTVWTLVMHWMDLAWLSFPAMHVAPDGGGAEHAATLGALLADGARLLPAALQPMADHGEQALVHGARFSWVDFTAGLGLFLVFYGATIWRLGRHAITPYNDPYFRAALRFENV
jgi:hypothetical protein